MTIAAGERIPNLSVGVVEGGEQRTVPVLELLAGRRLLLFGVPGAFTPGCTEVHLPGYLEHADELRSRGVEALLCLSVNDVYVMAAWAEATGAGERITMVADGNGELTRALGLELDASRFGMGPRSRRFAAVVDDGVVEWIAVEPAGGVTVSGAAAMLAALAASDRMPEA